MMYTHRMVDGSETRTRVSPAEESFLKRLRALAEDDSVTESQVIDLAYSRSNPFLGEAPAGVERGWATNAVLASPGYAH